MLLEELGYISKKVVTGENSGYEPDLEITLGFELWAGIRYSFFMAPTAHSAPQDEQLLMATFNVEGYGLYISKLSSSDLVQASRRRFGTNYLGCIH